VIENATLLWDGHVVSITSGEKEKFCNSWLRAADKAAGSGAEWLNAPNADR
jgi:hypothetical protein